MRFGARIVLTLAFAATACGSDESGRSQAFGPSDAGSRIEDAANDFDSSRAIGAGGGAQGLPDAAGSGGASPSAKDAGSVPRDAALADAGTRDGEVDAGSDARGDGGPVCGVSVVGSSLPVDPCDAMSEAACARLESCAFFSLRQLYGTRATCEVIQGRDCRARYGLPGQPATLLGSVHDCAVRLLVASCRCVSDEMCPELSGGAGLLPDGSGCRFGDQCAGGVCTGGTANSCGACSMGGSENDACGGANPDCAAGLICGIDRKCVRLSGVAKPCVVSAECARGLTCVNGACARPLSEGADCNASPDACDEPNGMFCVGGACKRFQIGGSGSDAGEPCGFGVDGLYAACDAFSRCIGGRCVAREPEGAACSPSSNETDPTCEPPFVCDPTASRCAVPTVMGCAVDAGVP